MAWPFRTVPGGVPSASPSRRRAQTWRSLFIAPCALLQFLPHPHYPSYWRADFSLNNPPAMSLNRVVHGIGSQVSAIGPLHRTHDHSHLSENIRVA